MVTSRNPKRGLDDYKWTKEMGLERGSYTPGPVHFIPTSTLQLPHKSTQLCREKDLLHVIYDSALTHTMIN